MQDTRGFCPKLSVQNRKAKPALFLGGNLKERIAVFVLAFLASLTVMFVGYDAYEHHQRRLIVLAALDPGVTDVNLAQLKTIRNLLEDRLRTLEPDVKRLAPDLKPGSIEVVVFPQTADRQATTYLILVRYHDQGFGFSVLNSREAATIDRAVVEIENSVKLFLKLRRQYFITRPGHRVAGAVF